MKRKYHEVVQGIHVGEASWPRINVNIKTEAVTKPGVARRIQYRDHGFKLSCLPLTHALSDPIYSADWNIARVHPKERGEWVRKRLQGY